MVAPARALRLLAQQRRAFNDRGWRQKVGRNYELKHVRNAEGLDYVGDRHRVNDMLIDEIQDQGSRLSKVEVLSWRDIVCSTFTFQIIGAGLFLTILIFHVGRLCEQIGKFKRAQQQIKQGEWYEAGGGHGAKDDELWSNLMALDKLQGDPLNEAGNPYSWAGNNNEVLQRAFGDAAKGMQTRQR